MAYSGYNDQGSYYGLAASYAEYTDLVDPNYYQLLLPAVGGGGRSGPWGFGRSAPPGGGAPAKRNGATGGGEEERRRRGAWRRDGGGEERGGAAAVERRRQRRLARSQPSWPHTGLNCISRGRRRVKALPNSFCRGLGKAFHVMKRKKER